MLVRLVSLAARPLFASSSLAVLGSCSSSIVGLSTMAPKAKKAKTEEEVPYVHTKEVRGPINQEWKAYAANPVASAALHSRL